MVRASESCQSGVGDGVMVLPFKRPRSYARQGASDVGTLHVDHRVCHLGCCLERQEAAIGWPS